VDAERVQPLVPVAVESAPRLRPVTDDGEASRRASPQQHLPLCISQILGLVDDDVCEWPVKEVPVCRGHGVIVEQTGPQIVSTEHGQCAVRVVIGTENVIDDIVHVLALFGQGATSQLSAPRRLRIAETLPRGVQQWQIRQCPGARLGALQAVDLIAAKPGRTTVQIGRHAPQVADQVARVENRPCPTEVPSQIGVGRQRPVEQLGWDVIVVLVHQDIEQREPDLVAAFIVGRRMIAGIECLAPVVGIELDLVPVRFHQQRLGRRFLVKRHGRFYGTHHGRGRLERSCVRIALDPSRATLGDQIPQRAGCHTLLAEARQHIGDVVEIGLVRPDHQDSSAMAVQTRIGVQQIGRPMQRDDRLARAGAALDNQGTFRIGPDDGILIGLDRAQHIAHLRRADGAQAGDESRLVVQGSVALERFGSEHLVPVITDAAVPPSIAAATEQAHRRGMSGSEEGLGRRRPPVNQQLLLVIVAQADASDIDRPSRVVSPNHSPQTDVETKPLQDPQLRRCMADLRVTFRGGSSFAAGSPAKLVELSRQLRGSLLQTSRDCCEMLAVSIDQVGIGFGRIGQGKGVENFGGHGAPSGDGR